MLLFYHIYYIHGFAVLAHNAFHVKRFDYKTFFMLNLFEYGIFNLPQYMNTNKIDIYFCSEKMWREQISFSCELSIKNDFITSKLSFIFSSYITL